MQKKSNAMVRINSRITPIQHKFIKLQAKKLYRTEGEVLRIMVDFYMDNNKK